MGKLQAGEVGKTQSRQEGQGRQGHRRQRHRLGKPISNESFLGSCIFGCQSVPCKDGAARSYLRCKNHRGHRSGFLSMFIWGISVTAGLPEYERNLKAQRQLMLDTLKMGGDFSNVCTKLFNGCRSQKELIIDLSLFRIKGYVRHFCAFKSS